MAPYDGLCDRVKGNKKTGGVVGAAVRLTTVLWSERGVEGDQREPVRAGSPISQIFNTRQSLELAESHNARAWAWHLALMPTPHTWLTAGYMARHQA